MARKILHRTATVLSSIPRGRSRISFVETSVVFQTRRHAHCVVRKENAFIKVSEEVREAIETRKPVVALETTIYTHGG